jgi:hypothetical protein
MKATIDRQLWVNNLVGVARQIADSGRQESRWTASDRFPWERPEELINELFDDCNFELFIEQHGPSMSANQMAAVGTLRQSIDRYCEVTPSHLVPEHVLADPRWHQIRRNAAKFVEEFA